MAIYSEMLRGRDVFAPAADIRVPAYQRGFAWTEKEVGELTRDLVEAFTQSVIFFLGTLVLVQPRARGPGDIVDGQQRLTTLTIILAVLRDLTPSKDVAYTAHSMIGHETPAFVGDKQKWRLTLNSMDAEFFRKFVQTKNGTKDIDAIKDAAEESGSESQKRIAMAVQAIHDELDQISPQEQERFVNWLANDLHVSKVRVTEHNIAYKVYLVLNRRGLPLSDHDILKAALLERAGFPPKEAVKHSERWNSFANRLGHDAFEAMLKQVRFLYDRQMKGEFLDAILLSILPFMTIANFINDKLPRFVDAFDAIVNGAKTTLISFSPETEKRLTFLREIHHEGWRAPAMKYLVDYANDDQETDRFFTKLERLAYMLQYGGRPRDFRQRRYRKLLDAMDSPGWMTDPESPLELSGVEQSDFRERLRGRFPNFKQRRALLMRINASVPGGRVLPSDADATVEHILPRNPPRDSGWFEAWSKKRDREELVECIGNFTLLTDAENQTADRKSFEEKKAIFFENGAPTYELTADLRDKPAWTPEEARARREWLVEIMSAEWDLT